MKQAVITGVIILVIVGLLSVIVWGSKDKQVTLTESSADQTSVSVSPTTADSNTPIFFYGNTCPHCKDVEEWMRENKIEEKIQIVKKEVYDNRQNSQELTEVAESCGLPTNSIGVPFLYTTDKKCLIGTPDITAYLADQVKALEQNPDASESGERSQE